MPVLGHHHVAECLGELVDDRDDLVAALHRKAAAGQKAVLHVNDDQNRCIVDFDPAGSPRLARTTNRGHATNSAEKLPPVHDYKVLASSEDWIIRQAPSGL